jgi:glycosyltransferase involved in cell wall biosynthesis
MFAMRLCFFHYAVPHDISGVTTWLCRLVPHLIARGHEVSCLLHHLGSVEVPSETFRALMNARARVVEVERPRMTEDCVGSVLEFLRAEGPELFLPQCLFEGFLAGGIAGRAGLPWIITLHSDDEDYWQALGASKPELSSGHCVAVSRRIAEIASRTYGVRYPDIIPCGVAVGGSEAQWSEDVFTVVFSGRVVEHQKRISLVVAAMIEACRRNARVRGRILGNGGDLAVVRREVAAAGMAERITFAGAIDGNGVRRELAEAQAILMMSDFEGLPVALLEAMSHGVVPIARRIKSGIPELVTDKETGLLVSEEPEVAAAAICELADSEQLWLKCSAGARALFERDYREDLCFGKWDDLIRAHCLPPDQARRVKIPRRFKLPPRLNISYAADVRKPSAVGRAWGNFRRALSRARREAQAAKILIRALAVGARAAHGAAGA